jgi:hypothetical protein
MSEPTTEQVSAAKKMADRLDNDWDRNKERLIDFIMARDLAIAEKATGPWREAVTKILQWATERTYWGRSMDNIEVEAAIVLRDHPTAAPAAIEEKRR